MKTVDPTLLNDADFSAQVTLERAIKPAAKWKNKYQAMEDCTGIDAASGKILELVATEVVWSTATWPTKDAAETKAHEIRADDELLYGSPSPLKYLGAHPADGDA